MGEKGTTEDGQVHSDTKGEYWINLQLSEISYKQKQTVQFSHLRANKSQWHHADNIFPFSGTKNLH